MKKIIFNHEHVDHYDGQDNYELGIYEDDDENPIGFSSETVIGYVAYTVYNNEITVSDIIIRPNRRREGFGSMLIKKMKSYQCIKNCYFVNSSSKYIQICIFRLIYLPLQGITYKEG